METPQTPAEEMRTFRKPRKVRQPQSWSRIGGPAPIKCSITTPVALPVLGPICIKEVPVNEPPMIWILVYGVALAPSPAILVLLGNVQVHKIDMVLPGSKIVEG
jgi:hypothetical protein